MALIKTLKSLFNNEKIYPTTKTSAVYDDVVGRLDTFFHDNLYVGADVLESETEDLPRDADTLGGLRPSEFVKASDVVKSISITENGKLMDGKTASEAFSEIRKDSNVKYDETQDAILVKHSLLGWVKVIENVYVKALIPIMQGETLPSGRAYASTSYSIGAPWQAFCGVSGSNSYIWHSNAGHPQWLAYNFGKPVCVTKLSFRNRNDDGYNTHAIKQFIFQGSNDGSNWEDIQSFTRTELSPNQLTEYEISNSKYYNQYRIYATQTTSDYTVIGACQMYGHYQ